MKIAYFGSEASNTHIVALQTFENEELISKATILDCFKAVENGEIKQEFGSTAAAAKRVAENPEKKYAAIANLYAAKFYNLKVLNSNIQDFEQNHTKFIVISKKDESLKLSKNKTAEKTSLILTMPEDHAGGLHQVLSVFAWRKMNLTKIESRTLKTGLGNYFFFINIDGNWESVLYKNAIEELESINVKVKFLGHYEEYLLES